MSLLAFVNGQRPPQPLYDRLEVLRAREVEPLLLRNVSAVRAIGEACTALLGTSSASARAVIDEQVRKLLSDLRASTQTASARADRAAHQLDGLLHNEAPELLDLAFVPDFIKTLNMGTLSWINWIYGSVEAWSEAMQDALGPLREAHVYDLAAGSGGFARHVAAHPPENRSLRLTSSDLSAEHVEAGRRKAARAGLAVHFEVRDALDLREVRDVDLFTCTYAAHHLTPGQVVRLISQAIARAPRGLALIDTPRSFTAYFGTALAVQLVAPVPTALFDALRSVRRSYTPAEFRLFATLAGARRITQRYIGPGHCFLHVMS